MHINDMANQDLKPSNVLVFRQNSSKLGDVGRAAYRGHSPPHETFACAGDPAYAPPEALYDYRDPSIQVLNGRVKDHEIEAIQPIEFLYRVIITWPLPPLPNEIIPVMRGQIRGDTSGFPQVVYTCHLFGVLATRAVLDILGGRPVRPRTIVDVNDILRPAGERARVFVARIRGLLALNSEFRRSRSQG